MRANTRQESWVDQVSRVDWWGVVSLAIVSLSAVLSGWIIAALADFVRRHWL